MSIGRHIEFLQVATLRNLTTQIIVADVQHLQIPKRPKSLRKQPIDTVVPKIQVLQVLRQPYFPHIKSQQVVRQNYLLRIFVGSKQHRRVSLQHVPGQVHQRQVQLVQRSRNLPAEAVARKRHRRELLGEGPVGVRYEAGDVVSVEAGGRFHLGQEIGYLAGDFGVGDVERTEFGEFGDGWGDCTDKVGDVVDYKKVEVGKVGDGRGNWVGFREVEVGEVEACDAGLQQQFGTQEERLVGLPRSFFIWIRAFLSSGLHGPDSAPLKDRTSACRIMLMRDIFDWGDL
ncbi:hypothetical protein CR513_51880, partial [Mucuna pruriens]